MGVKIPIFSNNAPETRQKYKLGCMREHFTCFGTSLIQQKEYLSNYWSQIPRFRPKWGSQMQIFSDNALETYLYISMIAGTVYVIKDMFQAFFLVA